MNIHISVEPVDSYPFLSDFYCDLSCSLSLRHFSVIPEYTTNTRSLVPIEPSLFSACDLDSTFDSASLLSMVSHIAKDRFVTATMKSQLSWQLGR